jgi:signal transduction histidine kinase
MDNLVIILVVVIVILAGTTAWLSMQLWRQTTTANSPATPNSAASRLDAPALVQPTAQELSDLRQEMAKADEIILKLRRAIAAHESNVDDLREQIEAQASLIANLRGQITTSELGSVESKALYSTVSAVSFDNVFVLNEEGIIIATNQVSDTLFNGRNPIGEKLTEALDAPELAELIDRAREDDDDLEEQLALNGAYYRVRTRVICYDNVHSFIGVAMQDITQLVRLNRARRDMVANISHELRTPIANIRMIIEGLFHEAEKPKRKASISTLRAILRETDSLLWLVQELLDLSMIESGQAIMKLFPAALVELVNDTTERLQDQLRRKDLKVVLHVPERIRVLCDWEQTRRVLINLIHNAIKWSPQGGAITISASYQGDDVLISVFDNGPGVPDDQRERIFERFYQVDTSRSSVTGGSGLGLAICRHIVEAHGGRIWAEGNSLGRGGRFFFTLLAGDEQHKPAPEMTRGQHDFVPLPSLPNAALLEIPDDDRDLELIDDEALPQPPGDDSR